jgi:hypothetical protein
MIKYLRQRLSVGQCHCKTQMKQFLPTLNKFFDLCEGLTDASNSEIRWYSYTIASNRNYIRAKSVYYNQLSFSNVLVNMSEEEAEDYNTYEGACFGKVRYYLCIIIQVVFGNE